MTTLLNIYEKEENEKEEITHNVKNVNLISLHITTLHYITNLSIHLVDTYQHGPIM